MTHLRQNAIKFWNRLITRSFRLFEKYLHVHVTPVHFYSPIPATHELPDRVYTDVSAAIGVDWNLSGQLSLLQEIGSRYLGEYHPPVNTGLSQVDSFLLYSMIRQRQPRKIIEIGSGESTRIALAAIRANARDGYPGVLYAIEPYPHPYLHNMDAVDFQLRQQYVQDVALDFFTDADVVFIDSSHVAKIGSDVNYEMLEIVPRVKPSALVHWHDILIPRNYPRSWIENGNMFWNESYFVQTFMSFNASFRVRWASHYLQVHQSEALSSVLPFFSPADPEQQNMSFWVERVK